MTTVYDAAGGASVMRDLAHAWHARVLDDPVVSHAFSHGFHEAHTDRLAAYWAEALGGPPVFSTTIADESTVLRMHSGNGPHEEMDRRAVDCFAAALDDVGLTGEVRTTMLAYFTWAVAYMDSHPRSPEDVPDGLSIPKWGWDGPRG